MNVATYLRSRVDMLIVLLLTVAALVAGLIVAQTQASPTLVAPNVAHFRHVATYPVDTNGEALATRLGATRDGRLLVHTIADGRSVGVVDISEPTRPVSSGSIELAGAGIDLVVADDLAYVVSEPTVGANTGRLEVIDLRARRVLGSEELRGVPTDVAASADGRVVVAAVAGSDVLPGSSDRLVIIEVADAAGAWLARDVPLRVDGISIAPSGVAVSPTGLIAVTSASGNSVVIVDPKQGDRLRLMPAGSVELVSVDATEDELGSRRRGVISPSETITVERQPSAVTWLDENSLVIANEGSGDAPVGGGARGFTVLNVDGSVEFESGATLEHAAVAAGGFPENRSANRGIEPEAVSAAEFTGESVVMVAATRANLVGIYAVEGTQPVLRQMLPTGALPSGLAAMPTRGLLAVAARGADPGDHPSMITLYEWRSSGTPPAMLSSVARSGSPLAWGTLSGLTADPSDPSQLLAVSDGYYGEMTIVTIEIGDPGDPARPEPRIIDRLGVTNSDGRSVTDLDAEGVAASRGGGAWIISETGPDGADRAHLVRIDSRGRVTQTIPVPVQSRPGLTESVGYEGVALAPRQDENDTYVYVTAQVPGDGDPVGHTRVLRHDLATGAWDYVLYPLDAHPLDGARVGVSDLTSLPDGRFAVIERDDLAGPAAVIKRVISVHLGDPALEWAPIDADPVGATRLTKRPIADLLPLLAADSVWTPDKVEGVAVIDDELWAVTDNDGVNDSLGHTLLVRTEI